MIHLGFENISQLLCCLASLELVQIELLGAFILSDLILKLTREGRHGSFRRDDRNKAIVLGEVSV